MRKKIFLSLLLICVMTLNFTSNSEGKKPAKGDSGKKGIMITLTSKKGFYSDGIGLILFDKGSKSEWGVASGGLNQERNDFAHGAKSVNIYLRGPLNQNLPPFTKTGDYILELKISSQGGGADYFYFTNGQELSDLGINKRMEERIQPENFNKLPTYNLKASGNTIDIDKFR